jgi:hypothetical protein
MNLNYDANFGAQLLDRKCQEIVPFSCEPWPIESSVTVCSWISMPYEGISHFCRKNIHTNHHCPDYAACQQAILTSAPGVLWRAARLLLNHAKCFIQVCCSRRWIDMFPDHRWLFCLFIFVWILICLSYLPFLSQYLHEFVSCVSLSVIILVLIL